MNFFFYFMPTFINDQTFKIVNFTIFVFSSTAMFILKSNKQQIRCTICTNLILSLTYRNRNRKYIGFPLALGTFVNVAVIVAETRHTSPWSVISRTHRTHCFYLCWNRWRVVSGLSLAAKLCKIENTLNSLFFLPLWQFFFFFFLHFKHKYSNSS